MPAVTGEVKQKTKLMFVRVLVWGKPHLRSLHGEYKNLSEAREHARHMSYNGIKLIFG